MIKCVVDTRSYFTYPADPSPFVGFPAALGIEVPDDKLYDTEYMMTAIADKLAEADMTGHMGTWTAPVMTLFMTGSYAYAEAFCEGRRREAGCRSIQGSSQRSSRRRGGCGEYHRRRHHL